MILPALFELAAGTMLNLDLGKLDACPKGSSDEIVVCGSRNRRSPYRLPDLPHSYDRKPIRAETTIGGVPARVDVQSQARPDGLVDKRVMITISTAF